MKKQKRFWLAMIIVMALITSMVMLTACGQQDDNNAENEAVGSDNDAYSDDSNDGGDVSGSDSNIDVPSDSGDNNSNENNGDDNSDDDNDNSDKTDDPFADLTDEELFKSIKVNTDSDWHMYMTDGEGTYAVYSVVHDNGEVYITVVETYDFSPDLYCTFIAYMGGQRAYMVAELESAEEKPSAANCTYQVLNDAEYAECVGNIMEEAERHGGAKILERTEEYNAAAIEAIGNMAKRQYSATINADGSGQAVLTQMILDHGYMYIDTFKLDFNKYGWLTNMYHDNQLYESYREPENELVSGYEMTIGFDYEDVEAIRVVEL